MVDRHVREAAAYCHVTDRPEPLARTEMVIRLEKTRRRIEADGLQSDFPEVGTAPGCDEQLLTSELAAVLEVDGHGVGVLFDRLRPRAQV